MSVGAQLAMRSARDCGNGGRVSDLHEEGRCAILLHGMQHKWLPKALLQAKGDHATVAGGTHPNHEVVITCNYGIAETAGAWSELRACAGAMPRPLLHHDPCGPNSVRATRVVAQRAARRVTEWHTSLSM